VKAEPVFTDTNLFLRFLTNDVPEQAAAFERLVRQAQDGQVSLVTNSMVMAELVWTLESYYALPPVEIQARILAILNTPGLEIEDGEILLQAILWYVEKHVDFIDAFNAAWMINHGIQSIGTVDRKHFAHFEGIRFIEPGTSIGRE